MMPPDAESTWNELRKAQRDSPLSDGLSRFRLFNRAADDLARVLDDAACRAALDLARAQAPIFRPACAQCRASALEHFFTFTRTGAVLCEACFAGRMRSHDSETEPWTMLDS